jgi:hypothetical protein
VTNKTKIVVETITGEYRVGWRAVVEEGLAEGATATGDRLTDVLAEVGSIIEVCAMREGVFAVPQTGLEE